MRIILFVDDEDYLVDVGKNLLEDYGYKVDGQTSPENALALFNAHPDRYGLLISDYTMPGINGVQLAEAVRESNPDLPVILCSGSRLGSEIQACVSNVLLKPFDIGQLVSAVREWLDVT